MVSKCRLSTESHAVAQNWPRNALAFEDFFVGTVVLSQKRYVFLFSALNLRMPEHIFAHARSPQGGVQPLGWKD